MSNMSKDHFYAEMLNMMREQGKKDNPTTLQLGVMQSETSVKIDDLILTEENLYIADYLLPKYKREIKTPYLSNVKLETKKQQALSDASLNVETGEYVHSVALEKQSGEYLTGVEAKLTKQEEIEFTDGLKKGDLVAVQKLQNNNMYVILARVVSA